MHRTEPSILDSSTLADLRPGSSRLIQGEMVCCHKTVRGLQKLLPKASNPSVEELERDYRPIWRFHCVKNSEPFSDRALCDLAFAKSGIDDLVADRTTAGHYEINDTRICSQNVQRRKLLQ